MYFQNRLYLSKQIKYCWRSTVVQKYPMKVNVLNYDTKEQIKKVLFCGSHVNATSYSLLHSGINGTTKVW